jgi:general secretion pathway protein G
MHKDTRKQRRNSGFTLIELMVVVVILGILAALVAPRLMGAVDEADVSAARTQVSNFKTALKMFKLEHKRYPTTSEGLQALVNFEGKSYLDSEVVPKDPWGNEYIYMSPGKEGRDFEIISLGADGMEGGSGINADIASYNLQGVEE